MLEMLHLMCYSHELLYERGPRTRFLITYISEEMTKNMGNRNPRGRTDDIVVQELNGEVLVYDLRDDRAMCLNETSAAVWQACDGSNSVADIAKKVGNEDIVWLALDQLKKEKLVEASFARDTVDGSMSRREVVRRIGIGSMVALPVIASLVAPVAAQTASCGTACRNPSDCPNQTCNRCTGTNQTVGICQPRP